MPKLKTERILITGLYPDERGVQQNCEVDFRFTGTWGWMAMLTLGVRHSKTIKLGFEYLPCRTSADKLLGDWLAGRLGRPSKTLLKELKRRADRLLARTLQKHKVGRRTAEAKSAEQTAGYFRVITADD